MHLPRLIIFFAEVLNPLGAFALTLFYFLFSFSCWNAISFFLFSVSANRRFSRTLYLSLPSGPKQWTTDKTFFSQLQLTITYRTPISFKYKAIYLGVHTAEASQFNLSPPATSEDTLHLYLCTPEDTLRQAYRRKYQVFPPV